MEELSIPEKIRRLKHIHCVQINQVDLSLETAPRDSRYSNNLLEMMKKEDMLLARDPTSPTTRMLISKVDDGLRIETQGFFNRLAMQNLKKWEKVNEKFRKDRQQLRNEISTSRRGVSLSLPNDVESLALTAGDKTKIYSAEEIDAEEERIKSDYYKNWHNYETYHLNQAFSSQLSRIDADWSSHEREIHNDYANKKAGITGYRATALNDVSAQQQPEASRWQHPEKQKTLIHTAPVFSPQRPSSGKGARKAQVSSVEVSNSQAISHQFF
jgi:hypothetical protein